jgi:hypothetical protein
MGWCFAVIRNGRFETEDFFLRPDERFPGNFNRLVSKIRQASEFLQSPVTFCIPHVDAQSKSANFETVNELIRALALKVGQSRVPWASYRADEDMTSGRKRRRIMPTIDLTDQEHAAVTALIPRRREGADNPSAHPRQPKVFL